MKSDLQRLMKEHDLDAILITGGAQHNPSMMYLTGKAHLTNADLILHRYGDAVLFCNPMERDEAARSGLTIRSLADYPLQELLKQTGGDYLGATVLRYQKILEDLGMTSGRLAVFGKIEAGSALEIFTRLEQTMPDLEIIGEFTDSVIMQAMATKDEEEIERIRQMGLITTEVVSMVAEYLTSHQVRDEILIKSDGSPLKIGDVKRFIRLRLAEREAEDPEGVIFAIGRDAGVPHSSGNPHDLIKLGQTIVFDIFPCEAGGGYFYDFTRTWCLGYTPDSVMQIYEDVLSVFNQIMNKLEVDALCKPYHEHACELFENHGHPTIRSNPQTLEGYVHGLGHGVGLNIHEYPRFGIYATDKDRLSPGVVFTIEPGLYYPERGIGIRLEDTVCIHLDGKIETLAPYPHDLVLPMKSR